MPQVIITENAIKGLEKCRQFLLEKNFLAAERASKVIEQYFSLLEAEPEIGRPLQILPKLRELIIPFDKSGYVSLYHFDDFTDRVYVLSLRHQKEAGY